MPEDKNIEENQIPDEDIKDESEDTTDENIAAGDAKPALDEENIEEQITVNAAHPFGDDSQVAAEKTQYGLVKPRLIEREMQESYLAYAMSVIVSRALPDVRDGLKPVHRRVLFSMNELGLTSKVKYRKSATIVGDVLGKYHPHGDVAVYDTLVRMAQPFSMRYPLVDGQGNFGSLDGDSAAAMRYTEAKMTILSEELLADIDKNTVDFLPNFDGTRQEPQVLPCAVPQLLLNGTLGIAVGMATNIPPHNLGEIVDGTIALINNPELTVEDLMGFIPGPDFPTGGEIYNVEDIKIAYATGKGRVLMRAVANIEEKKSGGFRIIVSEIPYQVNKAELITKIADLVKLKKIDGISDLRDESDRKDGVRIVIELRNSAYPKKVLNRLYELTAMQGVFHVNMLALVDGIQPKILTLKNVLEEFIKHRRVVVRRRTLFELNKAKDRAHILEGLKIALDHIDEVITTIRESETKDIAHKNLIAKFALSDKQSTAILEMKLSALAGLERKKVEDELDEKKKLIARLEKILADEKEILDIIKKELLELKEKYHDERRTKIYKQNIGEFRAEDLIPNEQVIVSLTKTNYIKRVPVSTYRAQIRGGKGVAGMATKEEDTVEHLLVTWTLNDIMFFTDKGRVFVCKVYDLPSSSRQAKGQAIVNILQLSPDEKVTAIITMDPKKKDGGKYFIMGTKKGVIKKTLIDAYSNVRKTGLIAIKLNSGDELKWVLVSSGDDKVMMITKNGQSIRFLESDVRPMGRSAAGVRGIKLRQGDEVISTNIASNETATVFTILENGFGKRTNISNFTPQKRGGIGIRASKVSNKTGRVVEAMVVETDEGDVVIISKNGQVLRTTLKSVKKLGRDTQGVTLMRLKASDKVSSMTLLKKEKIEEPNENNQDDSDSSGGSEDSHNDEKDNSLPDDNSDISAASEPKQMRDIIKEKNDIKKTKKLIEDSAQNLAEGKMDEDDSKKQKTVHINKIEPKKIIAIDDKKEFNPVVKANSKANNVKSKEFVPYLKSSKYKPQGLPNISNDNFQVKHYQSDKDSKSEDSVTPKKQEDENYWGKQKSR